MRDESGAPDEDRLRERLRKRAVRLIEYAPRTSDELRIRLAERPWARDRRELIEAVIAECEAKGLIGGEGHERAMRDRLFAYAADLLARAPRTRRQLHQRLSRPPWSSPALVEDVMEALERYGYVDDEAFARRYAERRASTGKSGPRRLRLELRAQGIDDRETIERSVREAVERTPEADAVEALIAKRLRGRPATDVGELRRLRDFLLRRGFDPEIVSTQLRALKCENLEDSED